MKKKILIGSILAVSLLTLVSFSSVVGYSSEESDFDISVEENKEEIVHQEELSEEDCGCEDESLNLGGFFPILCTLLFPLYIISWNLFWFGVSEIPIQIVMPLGYRFGCDWV